MMLPHVQLVPRVSNMKITGPGQIRSKSVKKSRKSSGGDGASFASKISGSEVSESSSSTSVGATNPLANIDALLTLQEAPTSTEGRSKGLHRANLMIEALEELRRGLLLGRIPMNKLQALAMAARERKETMNDPALLEILLQIELRAEVELAKLGF